MGRMVMIPCSKRRHSSGDRISQLSDDILIYILSSLTVKEAAVTSILSKRWINVWKYTTRLNFDASVALDRVAAGTGYVQRAESSKYRRWVNQVLKLNESSKLEELRICFDLRINHEKTISKWIKHAFARGVERLELDLSEKYIKARRLCKRARYDRHCAFPDPLSMLTGASSRGLRSEYYSSQSLRSLYLNSINVSGQVLEYLLHNCPLLQCLVVHNSDDLVSLEVSGQSLKLRHLEIQFCHSLRFLKVSNTNLISLVIQNVEELQVHHVPMLVEVYIRHFGQYEDFSTFSSPFFPCFSQLEVLTLSVGIRMIEELESQEFPGLTNLKQLVLITELWEDTPSIMGITLLMSACPILHKVVLKLRNTRHLFRRSCTKVKVSGSPLQHLKVVEFSGYCGLTREVEFLEYMLKNATALEKIVIDPRYQGASLLYNEIKDVEYSRLLPKKLRQAIPEHVEVVIL